MLTLQGNHYEAGDGTIYQRVTTLVDTFFPKFDAVKQSILYAERNGLTPEYWLQVWEDNAQAAREYGTFVHNEMRTEIMCGLLEPVIWDGSDYGLAFREALFEYFAYKIKKISCITEQIVWSKKYKVAGTFDLLLKCEVLGKPCQILVDYKTGKDVDLYGYECGVMKAPYSALPTGKLMQAAIQMGIYCELINEQMGFTPDVCLVAHFGSDPITCEIHNVTKTTKVFSLEKTMKNE